MKKYIPLQPVARSIFFALVLFLSCFSSPPTARVAADEEYYACALSERVYFYSSPSDERGLFCLPYTYYVKILANQGDYCYVRYLTDTPPYQAVYGYCKTNDLTFVDYIPARPYLYYTITATYLLSDLADPLIADGVLSSVTLTYVYYGDLYVGSATYCYVSSEGKTGYLPKTMPVIYELNDDFTAITSSAESSDSVASSDAATFSASGVILLLVILPFLVVILFLFLPKRRPPSDTYEDFTRQ
jgi:hypothetical protein